MIRKLLINANNVKYGFESRKLNFGSNFFNYEIYTKLLISFGINFTLTNPMQMLSNGIIFLYFCTPFDITFGII